MHLILIFTSLLLMLSSLFDTVDRGILDRVLLGFVMLILSIMLMLG